MKSYRDYGITFKIKNFSEADQIVSILTKYNGRVDAIAKGVRKLKSRKRGNFDLLSSSKFSFYKGRTLDILIEAKLEEVFIDNKLIKDCLPLLNLCAVLDKTVHLGEINRPIYELLVGCLDRINIENFKLILCFFYIKFFSFVGYDPNLITCLLCDKKFKENSPRFSSTSEIGFLCIDEISNNTKKVSDKTLKSFRFIKDNDIEKVLLLEIDDNLIKEISSIINIWLKIATSGLIDINNFI